TRAIPIHLDAPDLVLGSATAPSTAGVSQQIDVSWTVRNQSQVAAASTWTDYVLLSSDPYPDNNDDIAYTQFTSQSLAGNASYTVNANIFVPNQPPAVKYLIFVANRNRDQGETDTSNNYVALP